MNHETRSHKESSRTWILGCFAAALVGLFAALIEVPFHQMSAMELAVVSGVCFVLGLTGWLSVTSDVESSGFVAQRTASVVVGSLPTVGVTKE